MKDKKIILVVSEEGFVYDIFYDAVNDERCTFLNTYKKLKSPFITWAEHAHLNRNLPFKWIWGIDSFVKKQVHLDRDSRYIVLCVDYVPYVVERIKAVYSNYDVKYALILLSKIAGNPRAQNSIRSFPLDYILTFDPADSKRYGYIYFDSFYSILSQNECPRLEYDLYYAGRYIKERLAIAHDIFLRFKEEAGGTCKFRVDNVPVTEQINKNEIIYNRAVSYRELVEEVKKTNCVLELLRDGQTGSSTKYYEAVCYNKKLLTNNKNVVNLPFYNPDYIYVFEKPEDIDWNWVKERIPVDYHYDGRFSPTHLIDKIIKLEEEKELQELGKEQIV